MWHYQPPLRDIRFVTEELLNLPRTGPRCRPMPSSMSTPRGR
jgi:hypothetical protein